VTVTKRLLGRCVARPAGSRPVRADPQIFTRQRMAMFAVRLADMPLVLGVGYGLQVVGVPAGLDAAAVMQLHSLRYWAPQELPAEPVSKAVLCLGNAAIRIGWPGEQPASSWLRVGRSEDGVVKQPLQVGTRWIRRTARSTWSARRFQIARPVTARLGPEPPLVLPEARPADPCSRPRVDPKVLTRQRVSMVALHLALVRQVLGVGDHLQVVRIPAGVDAAAVMELHAVRDRAAKQLPAQPVGIAILGLGDAPIGSRRPSEQPASAQLWVGRSENGAVNQSFQLRTTVSGPPPAAAAHAANLCPGSDTSAGVVHNVGWRVARLSAAWRRGHTVVTRRFTR
jgi:hypothetical protein